MSEVLQLTTNGRTVPTRRITIPNVVINSRRVPTPIKPLHMRPMNPGPSSLNFLVVAEWGFPRIT